VTTHRNKPPFLWALPEGAPLLPSITTASAEDYAAEAAALDWFITHRSRDDAPITLTAPVRRLQQHLVSLVQSVSEVAGSARAVAEVDLGIAVSHFMGRALAHWIRIVEGHNQRAPNCFTIDESFVSYLLGGSDRQSTGPWAPASFLTLYVAARCLHLGGGTVHVGGDETPGVDVYWSPTPDIAILIERKDRAMSSAFSAAETFERAHAKLLKRVEEATDGIFDKAVVKGSPSEVVAVSSVGGIYPLDVASQLHERGRDLAHAFLQGAVKKNPGRLPNALMLYIIGLDTRSPATASSLPHVVEFTRDDKAASSLGMRALRDVWAPRAADAPDVATSSSA
jgi:hypothetical protein